MADVPCVAARVYSVPRLLCLKGVHYMTWDEYRMWLLTVKRHAPLNQGDLCNAGKMLFDDENALRLYGMTPKEYLRLGCLILGRTAVEACLDQQAPHIASAVRTTLLQIAGNASSVIIDLFLGSGNLLYHIAKTCQATALYGFESQAEVLQCTKANLALLGMNVNVLGSSFEAWFPEPLVPAERYGIVIIDPPWGKNAFNSLVGLDIHLTIPPILEILKFIQVKLSTRSVLVVVKTHELLVRESIEEIKEHFIIYDKGATTGLKPGTNAGYLILGIRKHIPSV